MNTRDTDLTLMWMVFALLVVVSILGATRILDLDDAEHRYPSNTVPVTVYRPAP